MLACLKESQATVNKNEKQVRKDIGRKCKQFNFDSFLG